MNIWYTNVNYFDSEQGFVHGGFCVENGVFTCVAQDSVLVFKLFPGRVCLISDALRTRHI